MSGGSLQNVAVPMRSTAKMPEKSNFVRWGPQKMRVRSGEVSRRYRHRAREATRPIPEATRLTPGLGQVPGQFSCSSDPLCLPHAITILDEKREI
jgi:hypothetical protein